MGNYKLPEDFFFGAAMSGPQTEGAWQAYGKLNPEGAKCRGYHWWAVIDCWSWANAFKDRYGFVEVNLSDNYSRHLKKSADYLRRVATTHEIFES